MVLSPGTSTVPNEFYHEKEEEKRRVFEYIGPPDWHLVTVIHRYFGMHMEPGQSKSLWDAK